MIKQGFVGFFDILGYQTLIDNNDISKASQIIEEVIVNLPKRTSELLLSLVKDSKNQDAAKDIYNKIDARLISDSIILSLEMPKNADATNSTLLYTLAFLSYSSQLMRQAFDKGLPLRGAIDYGEFFFSGNCFAGKPIINCYRIGNQMDVAGCVITNDCYEIINSAVSNTKQPENIKCLYFDCLIVNKDGSNKRCHVLNWYCPYKDWGDKHDNLRSYVIDAFHANGKDITPDVVSKVNNTEIMLHIAAEEMNKKSEATPKTAT
jgi:hypothetical protein